MSINNNLNAQCHNFNIYLNNKINQATEKLENSASIVFSNINFHEKESNDEISLEESKDIIDKWLDHLTPTPSLHILKLKELLDAQNSKKFAINLYQFFKDLEKREKRDFASMAYFFIKEFCLQLDCINQIIGSEKELHNFPQNYFSCLAKLLLPGLFFAKLNRSLEKVIRNLEELNSSVQINFNEGHLIQSSHTLTLLSEIEGQLKTLEVLYTQLMQKNNDPLLPYRNASYIGNTRKHFREIADIFEAIQSTVSPDHDCRHLYCGCHFSYLGSGPHQSPHPIIPLQVVDVVNSQINLKNKIKKCEEPTKKSQLQSKLTRFQQIEDSAPELRAEPQNPFYKKNVLIITCSYGNGHNCSAQAVAHYLGKNGAHVEISDFSTDVLLSAQKIHNLGNFIGKNWKNADIFNYILRKQLYLIINRWHELDLNTRRIFGIKGKHGVAQLDPGPGKLNKKLIRLRLLMHMPDQIVTVYHMDLCPVLEIANEMGLPVIHLPTDVNMKASEPFDERPSHPHFAMFVPFYHPRVLQTAAPLQDEQLILGGYPVRPEFLNSISKEDVDKVKQKKGIDQDTKVVLMMSGGSGQSVPYPELLANSLTWDQKIHLIIIVGHNYKFAEYLKISLNKVGPYYQGSNKNVTIELAKDPATKTPLSPYYIGAQELADLMDLSDAAITKPGGSSVAELLYKGVPSLFDHRKELFYWEEQNVDLVTAIQRGLSNKSLSLFEKDLKSALKMEKQFTNRTLGYLNTRLHLCQAIAAQQKAVAKDPEMQHRQAQYRKKGMDENLCLSDEEAYEVRLNHILFSQDQKTKKLLIPAFWSQLKSEFKVENYGKIETENQALRLERYKDLIFQVQSLCERENIPFWLCCGTLLGAFRYQKQIPWDYDADAAILQRDFKKVWSLLKELENNDPTSYKVSDLSNPQDPGKFLRVWVKKSCGDGRGGAWLDIYSYEAKEDGLWFYGKKSDPRDIFPLSKAPFHEGEAWIPHHAEAELHIWYDDLTPVRVWNEDKQSWEVNRNHADSNKEE